MALRAGVLVDRRMACNEERALDQAAEGQTGESLAQVDGAVCGCQQREL